MKGKKASPPQKPIRPKKQACFYHFINVCTKPDCFYSHDAAELKNVDCKEFLSDAKCSLGDKCPMRHIPVVPSADLTDLNNKANHKPVLANNKDRAQRDGKVQQRRSPSVNLNRRYQLPCNSKGEVLIIDTSALMNMTQEQLQDLTTRLSTVELVVPYLVFNELDGLTKDASNQDKQLKAKQSREWLLQMQEAQLVRIQRREGEEDAAVMKTARCNDDRILACAVFESKREAATLRRSVRLLTNDRTFRLKAQGEGLTVCDTTEL